MLRLQRRTWGRLILGFLVIGGTFAVLWAVFQPTVNGTVEPKPLPKPPPLHDARALVVLRRSGSARDLRAVIACDGARRRSSGFWRRNPVRACDALASTRGWLLSGPGCRRPRRDRTTLHVTGHFGPRRFDHHAEQLGCPRTEDWLGVDALVAPALVPQQAATDARK